MNHEIYLTAPMTEWTERCVDPLEPVTNLNIQFSCGENNKNRFAFLLYVFDQEYPILSSGLLATEGMFLSLYLSRVDGRKPKFPLTWPLDQCWQTALVMRLYSAVGGTEASAHLWVEGKTLWLGFSECGHIVAKTPLNAQQRAGLTRLADAMDQVF
jgi:hypothetical protein